MGWIKVDTGDGPEPVYFREYALELIASMTGIEARTKADYERDVRRHMLPTFGHLDIRDTETFTHKTGRAWVGQLQDGIPDPRVLTHPHTGKDTSKAKKGRGKRQTTWLRPPLRPKSIHNLHGLLYLIFQAAVEEELRPTNPAARTKLPRLDDGEGGDDMCFLTREEFNLLRDSAHEDVRDMLEVSSSPACATANSPRCRPATSPSETTPGSWRYGGHGNATPTTPSNSAHPRPSSHGAASL
ncbi:hypothetical protein [Marinactinospora rubrisoli]|uniref:Integrase SAM-like N-terminal domain-containing protein n=1 Tax=Marinactinospora rubrisoli TaxID=2715399 RepID=A0ABW2KIN5_9ACTN